MATTDDKDRMETGDSAAGSSDSLTPPPVIDRKDPAKALEEALARDVFLQKKKPGSSLKDAATPASSAPITIGARKEAEIQEDVTRILEEAKLPERRGPSAKSAEPSPIPQSVSALVTPAERHESKKEPDVKNIAGLTREMAAHIDASAKIITPEGISAPLLSKTPHEAGAEKQLVIAPIAARETKAPPVPAQAPAGARSPEKPLETTLEEHPPTSSLRTLKDDLRELVSIRKMSLIHAATLESERRQKTSGIEQEAEATRARRRKRLVRFFLSVALFLTLGFAGLFAILVVQSERAIDRAPDFGASIIFAEQTLSYPLNPVLLPREVRGQLATSRAQGNLSLGAMERIVPTVIEEDIATGERRERLAASREFLSAISETVPDELLRALEDSFFFGVHTENENVPLLILPLVRYENAFAGMIAWEGNVNDDLSPLFTRIFYEKLDGETGAPIIARFEDASIRNYDVRVLKDERGDIKMLYSFPSRRILIITESPHAFIEALARLRAERRL